MNTAPPRPPPAFLFAILLFPFGATQGYFGVAIAYDLAQNGVSVAAISGLIALTFVPNTWKFLWAPVIDTTLTPTIWYAGSAVVLALGTAALGAIPAVPSGLTLMAIVAVAVNLVSTINGMACDYLAAHHAPEDKKGLYGGWLQAGNLFGTGMGGAMVWVSHVLPERWMTGALLGLSFVLCALALVALPPLELEARGTGLLGRVAQVGRDTWSVVRSRAGALAMLVLFLPIGTGAAGQLWSAIADDWRASVEAVATGNGALSGLAAGIGCLIGGYFCDRMDRKVSYALFGVLQAACVVAMALAPHAEANYIVFTLLYAVTSGLTYASFSAVSLEAIGSGAAATKYTLMASLANLPIQYMTLVEGYVHDARGASAMLYVEAVVAVIAIVVYGAVQRLGGAPRRGPLASGV